MNSISENGKGTTMELKSIPVDSIIPTKGIRENNGKLDELKASIKEHGLLQPITVYLEGEKYVVKTGYRRLQAYKELFEKEPGKFANIPCIVSDEKNKTVVQLVENIHRKDLSPVELCKALLGLREQGMNNQAIADVLGKKKTYIDNLFSAVKELESNPQLKELVTHVNVSLPDVVETKGVPDKKRNEILEKRGNGEISQKEMRDEVKALKSVIPDDFKIPILIKPNFSVEININISNELRIELKERINKALDELLEETHKRTNKIIEKFMEEHNLEKIQPA